MTEVEAGLSRIERALRAGMTSSYAIQGAIAALHARAGTATETDSPQIALLYAELMRQAPSPVIALNHAAAVGMAEGLHAGVAGRVGGRSSAAESSPVLRGARGSASAGWGER